VRLTAALRVISADSAALEFDQAALPIELGQLIEAADGLIVDEDLRDGGAPGPFAKPFPLLSVESEIDFLKWYAT